MAEHADGQYEDFDELELIEDKPKPAYSKVIVALCLVTVIAYTVTCFTFLWNGKPLNDALTILFFGCFGVEFASLAFIKGREIRYVGGDGNKRMPHVERSDEHDKQAD